MTIKAWPFLVGLNKKLGYQTIVCPRFLSEAGLGLRLAEAAGGDDSGPDSATRREILGSPVGDISLVFRVIKAKARDYGLGGDEVLLDRSGRSIHLIEGFVVQGRKSVVQVTPYDFQIAHELVKGVYHDFWQAQTIFEEISLPPFELSTEDRGASQLQVIKEKPLDLHSPLRKKIEPLTRPALMALVALVVFVGGIAGIRIVTQPTLSRTLSTFCSDLSAAQPNYNDAYNQFSSGFQALYPPSSFSTFFGKYSVASCSYQQTGDNSATLSIKYGSQAVLDVTLTGDKKIASDVITQLKQYPNLTTMCRSLQTADYSAAYNELSTRIKISLDEPNFAGFFTNHAIKSCGAQLQDTPSALLSITYQDSVSVSIPINLQEEQQTWKIATDIVNELLQKKM